MAKEWLITPIKKSKINVTTLLAYMKVVEDDKLLGVVLIDKKSKKVILQIKKDY